MTLQIIRSLFNTYADLLINYRCFFDSEHSLSTRLTSFLRRQLESIYSILMNLSHDRTYFDQIKRTVILFRLLECKWNRV